MATHVVARRLEFNDSRAEYGIYINDETFYGTVVVPAESDVEPWTEGVRMIPHGFSLARRARAEFNGTGSWPRSLQQVS